MRELVAGIAHFPEHFKFGSRHNAARGAALADMEQLADFQIPDIVNELPVTAGKAAAMAAFMAEGLSACFSFSWVYRFRRIME